MGTGPAAFLVGRERAVLPPEDDLSEDKLFPAIRIDGATIAGKRFHHCTFANISFKEVTLRDCEFLDCAFLNCYFRRANLTNSNFVGSKFYECDFPKASIQSCSFKYAKLHGCVIPKNEMEHNLPPEPNLREELAAELAEAADSLGHTQEARAYRLIAIRARQEHLWCAVRCTSTWYRNHYAGLSRIGASFRLLGSRTNGLIWGHGERLGVLLRNLVVLTLVIFPMLLLPFRHGLSVAGGSVPDLPQLVWISVGTMLPVSGLTTVAATSAPARILLALEAFTGIVIAGLFVTFLFRSVVRR